MTRFNQTLYKLARSFSGISCFKRSPERQPHAGGEGRLSLSASPSWLAVADASTPANLQLKDNLYGAKFIDARQGWVVGAFGVIARTGDGGDTWQMQPSKTTQQLYDIDFVDGQRRAGPSAARAHPAHQQRRDDLGAADQRHGPAPVQRRLRRRPARRRGGRLRHHPGHQRRRRALGERTLEQDIILYDVAMVDATHGWIAGEMGTILTTTDGGATWAQEDSGIDKTLFGVYFADAQHGWVVGIDALILHTSDGGQTWKVQNGTSEMRELEQVGFGQAYDNPSLYSISVVGDLGVVAGEIGAIYLSTDGGQTLGAAERAARRQGRSGCAPSRWCPAATGAIVGADGRACWSSTVSSSSEAGERGARGGSLKRISTSCCAAACRSPSSSAS